MIIIYIVVFLFLFVGVLFLLMARSYKIHPVPHSSTPEKLGIKFEEVWFPTAKNLQLYGWWIPLLAEKSKPVVILVHGWQRNVERMMPYIKELYREYNLLIFDSRNHGKSDLDDFSSMPKFSEDILAAINFICTKPGVDKDNISVLGLSMGGAAAIYAASVDKRIRSVITVGAFANPRDVMKLEFEKRHISYFPVVYLFFEYVQYKIGFRFNDFAPVNNINKVNAQILIVHENNDVTAPVTQAESLYKSSNQNKTELWIIIGAGHSNCHKFPEFWERIKLFLQNSMQ